MSIQKIINVCETLNIDRRKVVGVQFTRSELAKVSSTPTRNPWKFALNVTAGLQYSTNRDLLEDLDSLDRQYTETVSFSSVPGQAFIFAYQGGMTAPQQAGVRVSTFVGNQLVLTNLPVSGQMATTDFIVKKGDIFQITGYPHPFTATADVQRGSSATVTVTTHRPNFIAASVVNLGLAFGNSVQFKVFCPNMPTYTLIPGGTDALIEWTSEFQLYEYMGDVV
jgi:hypothetical protein